MWSSRESVLGMGKATLATREPDPLPMPFAVFLPPTAGLAPVIAAAISYDVL